MSKGIRNYVNQGSVVSRRLSAPRGGLGTLAAQDAQKHLDRQIREQIAKLNNK